RLRWRTLMDDDEGYNEYAGWWGYAPAAWLDAAKMKALGFDVALPDANENTGPSFQRQLSRDVLIVLELDGPAHQETLARGLKFAEKRGAGKVGWGDADRGDRIENNERNEHSRLFAIDAGLDAAQLRAKYPDRSRYAIVAGRVEPSTNYGPRKSHSGMIHGI